MYKKELIVCNFKWMNLIKNLNQKIRNSKKLKKNSKNWKTRMNKSNQKLNLIQKR